MQPFIGSIFCFGFNFAPYGWAQCNGQQMPISQYTALFSLIGTNFGGDGVQSFALPNLQGRTPIGTGQGPGLSNFVIGQTGGNENVTLTTANLPAHTHAVLTATIPVNGDQGDQNSPAGAYFGLADSGTLQTTYDSANDTSMAAVNASTGISGSNIPFSILSPFLVTNYCIALDGIFPQRN